MNADLHQLEGHPQGELHDSWKIILAGHWPEASATATTRIGRIKLHTIEKVEELSPELDADPFLGTKLSVLEDRKVKIFHSVVPYIRLGARIVAVAVIGRTAG